MLSVKDMTNLLELIPLWKQLKTLPDRVADLERKFAAIEQQPSIQHDDCPKCHQPTLELTDSQLDPTFGVLGVYQYQYCCSSCGFKLSKKVES